MVAEPSQSRLAILFLRIWLPIFRKPNNSRMLWPHESNGTKMVLPYSVSRNFGQSVWLNNWSWTGHFNQLLVSKSRATLSSRHGPGIDLHWNLPVNAQQNWSDKCNDFGQTCTSNAFVANRMQCWGFTYGKSYLSFCLNISQLLGNQALPTSVFRWNQVWRWTLLVTSTRRRKRV